MALGGLVLGSLILYFKGMRIMMFRVLWLLPYIVNGYSPWDWVLAVGVKGCAFDAL